MMEDRLVYNVSQILPLLLQGRESINTIVKQTGIYKNYVFDANEFLEKAKLASRTKDKEVHQQKIFVQLTEFGQELARFIVNTGRFEKSFDQLKKVIIQVYNIREGTTKSARSILLDRGLNYQEIESYEEDFGYAADFEEDSLSVLIEGIINKHALFLLEFHPNRYAKEFLREIISRRLSNYLLMKVESKVRDECSRCKQCGNDLSKQVLTKHRIDGLIEESGSRLFNFLEDYVHYPFNNRHTGNEIREIVSCLFSVFRLPDKYIEQKIKKEMENLNDDKISPYINEDEANRNIDSRRRVYRYLAELNGSA